MKNEIIEKIRKVLALSENNNNKNEVMDAILKAHELMAKYGIEEEEISVLPSDTISHDTIILKQIRFYDIFLTTCCKSLRCRVIFNGKNGLVYGCKEDIESVKVLYTFIVENFERLYKEYKKTTYKPDREGYFLGFHEELRYQLDKQVYALMIVTPKEVNEKIKEDFPSLSKRTMSFRGGREAVEKGKKDCQSLIDSRQIEEKQA